MSAPWSPQQHEWLQALGHDVLMLAGAPAPLEVLAAAPSRKPSAGPSIGLPAGTHARPDSPLLRAVLRAAGRRELGELAAWLPDLAVLRGNAAAKRALWPRLRTLRGTPSRA